jgi:PTS system mannose-specific IIC component
MIGTDVALLSVLGGVLGLDTVSFPQAMLSRPLVAATLGGALLGRPLGGLLLGATLELFAVDTLPFGASRYPEWGSSAVVAAGLFVGSPETAGDLTTAALAALAMAWVGGWSMLYVRRLNARVARRKHDAIVRGDRNAVVGLQVKGLTTDLARGCLLTAAGLLALAPLQSVALARWKADASLSRAVVVSVAAAVALGAVYKLFHGAPRFAWQLVIGLLGGTLLVVLR